MKREKYTFALAGNPNSGKTTMFNAMTGSSQTVGNWPGVTVEKKTGVIKSDPSVHIVDLPGIYSLSPYTQEEVVARRCLVAGRGEADAPDAIIDIVDATNLERNLYLTTQLLELDIPVVIALNMMDVVDGRGDSIDAEALAERLGCPVIETSALAETNIGELLSAAKKAVDEKKIPTAVPFPPTIAECLGKIAAWLPAAVPRRRYAAVKIFERDPLVMAELAEKFAQAKKTMPDFAEDIAAVEEALDDDSESLIISARYECVTAIVKGVRRMSFAENFSEKIDKYVTSRVWGLPIFALVMLLVYGISVSTIGTWMTDFTNDVFVDEWIKEPVREFLEGAGSPGWLTGVVADGIIGGVGSMLGFTPQMVVLFFFLAILEDCGYMARIAFLLDRLFHRFGMSGKSFIPMLIGTGCGIPGIMAARTIESEADRRLTIMTVTFMPCGAKLPLIAMISGALFGNSGFIAFSAYALGLASVVFTGIALKKFPAFTGQPSPFVVELPAYHWPSRKNVWHSIANRIKGFAKKAVSVYILAAMFVWFLSKFGWAEGAASFGMVEELGDSVAAGIGHAVAWIFAPCGFDHWQAVIAAVLGIAAKEEVVGVLGVFSSLGDADAALELVENGENLAPLAAMFGGDKLAGYAFMMFNLLCAPCFAAINTIRAEMESTKWALFAICYECIYAYLVALMIYQFGLIIGGASFTIWTYAAFAALGLFGWLLFRSGTGE